MRAGAALCTVISSVTSGGERPRRKPMTTQRVETGEARRVFDRMTKAVVNHDVEALAGVYAADAIASSPDGEIRGRDQILAYLKQFLDAFPDLTWEPLHSHESGNTAVDEGFIVGTHTEALTMPNGETIPATGKKVRFRECDAITVEDGLITSHRFYYDQMDVLGQLGLLPEMRS
jgi:ketosteroid isomerase-like protein